MYITLGRNSHEEMTSQLRGLWARPCSGSGQPASVSLSLTSGQAVNKTRPCRPAIKGLSIPHGPYAPATGSQNCRGLGVIREFSRCPFISAGWHGSPTHTYFSKCCMRNIFMTQLLPPFCLVMSPMASGFLYLLAPVPVDL